MAVPPQADFYRPVLEIAAGTSGRISRQQLIAVAASNLNVTDADRQEVFGGSRTSLVFDYRVTSAALKLSEAGMLDRPQRGHFLITRAGREFLSQHSGPIERRQLVALARASEALIPFSAHSSLDVEADDSLDENPPAETMATAYRGLLANLISDLRATVNGITPEQFEQLVVDLLVKMGYGQGETVGRSGDGGIDGIINQDALGLEKVYVQAKRWAGQVGEPEIRNFSGSLDAKGATKGVFITASTFSGTARQTAQTISAGNKFIRLVDGNELAQLMIRHGVGVVTEYTYEIKKLDENYFAEGI
ncbi:MAG: restriction endonuclease [Chloroflexi bacterium]|nr:restriction endonuclease [Chloroflexota bacterium]MYD47609.1 restriction endonuclease [Chloroflexota bacterium]